MRTDQIAVIDVRVIDILARLHLGLQFFDDIAFTDQVMGHGDAGDCRKGRREHLGFVLVGGDGLGDDLDFHSLEGLSGIDEPLHLFFLLRTGQDGETVDLIVQKGVGRLYVGKCRGHDQQRQRSGRSE